jgi:glycosyltransferase involved in cell wall biosynthesis
MVSEITSNRLKIALVTVADSADRRSWSGIPYYVAESLQKHCGDIIRIGPLRSRLELLGKFFNKFTLHLFKKRYDYKRSLFLSKRYAASIGKSLAHHDVDLIFSLSSAKYIAFLDTNIPIVAASDATFRTMTDYYDGFSNLMGVSIREINTIGRLATQNADLLLFPSTWAADSAIGYYHAEKRKVHVIPFGANLDPQDTPPRDRILSKRKSNECRLFFLGVDWIRKGGEIAFETLLKLEKFGIQARLVVCGCVPPPEFSHDRMTVIPFLDKNDAMQRAMLSELLLQSDFLLLPTRSEAYGIVFCEGNAFGLPAITTHTGGVPGVVKHGDNGFMLPLDARGDQYAKLIAEIYGDDHRYISLVRSSRAAFDERLNWDAWGTSVAVLVDQLMASNTSSTHL